MSVRWGGVWGWGVVKWGEVGAGVSQHAGVCLDAAPVVCCECCRVPLMCPPAAQCGVVGVCAG